tara:strand:- start:693 stop:893 length:201 start_codon:yes stop_codon:yes gene_type:complete
MELYYELSKEASKHIGLDLSSMEVLRMTIELKKLEEIYKPEFTKPHILRKTTGGTFIWIDTSYVKT